MPDEIVDRITEDMEVCGKLEFTIYEQELFNKEVKEFTVFYKIVGESRMKLFRNSRTELIFVRLNDDWMRQAKVDISGWEVPLTIKLAWDNDSEDELTVEKPGQGGCVSVKSVQIDN